MILTPFAMTNEKKSWPWYTCPIETSYIEESHSIKKFLWIEALRKLQIPIRQRRRGRGAFIRVRGICVDEPRYWHFDELSAATLFYPFFPPCVEEQRLFFRAVGSSLEGVLAFKWRANPRPVTKLTKRDDGEETEEIAHRSTAIAGEPATRRDF